MKINFIEWCIVNEKDEFLNGLDENELLDRILGMGRNFADMLGGRRPDWAEKLSQSDDERAEMFKKQLLKPGTIAKRERRKSAEAELARRYAANPSKRPVDCPPCPPCD